MDTAVYSTDSDEHLSSIGEMVEQHIDILEELELEDMLQESWDDFMKHHPDDY